MSNYAVVRYLADGSGLDPTFGVSGKVIVDISGTQDLVSSIVIQPDGKIVVGGSSVNGANADFTLIRLNQNGTLYNSFDGDGKVTVWGLPKWGNLKYKCSYYYKCLLELQMLNSELLPPFWQTLVTCWRFSGSAFPLIVS